MIGLILSLAIGQSCPGGVCPINATNHASVRVIVRGTGFVGHGSGTIIGNDGQYGYVLTNKHVVRGGNTFTVRHPSGDYTARLIKTGQSADLAALQIAAPPIREVQIATEPPQGEVSIYAFPGDGNQLVRHDARFVSGQPPNENEFSAGIVEGESGGGVFDASGRLAGVAWGSDHIQSTRAVSLTRVKEFLGTELCDQRIVTICPFFLKFKRITDNPAPAPVITTPIVTPTPIPLPSPAPVVVTPPQPVVNPFDPTAILARLAALENTTAQLTGNMTSLTTSVGQIASLVRQPITFTGSSPNAGTAQGFLGGPPVVLDPVWSAPPVQPTPVPTPPKPGA